MTTPDLVFWAWPPTSTVSQSLWLLKCLPDLLLSMSNCQPPHHHHSQTASPPPPQCFDELLLTSGNVKQGHEDPILAECRGPPVSSDNVRKLCLFRIRFVETLCDKVFRIGSVPKASKNSRWPSSINRIVYDANERIRSTLALARVHSRCITCKKPLRGNSRHMQQDYGNCATACRFLQQQKKKDNSKTVQETSRKGNET